MAHATCPHCQQTFPVNAFATIPDKQTLKMSLSYESDLMSADTLGASITNMSKVLTEVARSVGTKISVFVESISYGQGKVEIEFTVLAIKPA